MISHLHISNYALIDSIDIDFTPGLNIITGETGAGKSIMLGALGLLLGNRADVKAIRAADRKSVVEAIFNVTGNEILGRWAEANNLDWSNECIVRRELTPGGRTRAFINDTPVSVSQLADLGSRLLDIHSQNQNQLLASPDYQLSVIDSMAGNDALLADYSQKYNSFKSAEQKFKSAKAAIERGIADEEFIRFQLKALDEAQLSEGEQEILEGEREIQANMVQIKSLLTSALSLLSNNDDSVSACLSAVSGHLSELNDFIDDLSPVFDRLESARLEIQDITETLADYDANLAGDAAALERIEDRLGLIYALQKRHNLDSVEDLIQLRDSLRERLDAIEGGDDVLDELRTAAVESKKMAVEAAKLLSASRRKAAGKFAAELFEAASPLGLPNLRCEISVESAKQLLPSGADVVDFRFAFNKNQTPRSVAGVASGGEVSRLMLALKSVVSSRLQLPTIVFDEVDTGVSGDIANRMGLMMQQMASVLQVITITHLPQVAAKGVSHHKVYKVDDDNATHTRIKLLSGDEREQELALMLSGSATDETALATARKLLSR